MQRFKRIFVLDAEYQKPDGEKTRPVCLVVIELYSEQVYEIFFDRRQACPVEWREDDLVIGYNLAAECGVFIAAGWPFPPNMIDLYFEHLREMNGAKKTGRISDFLLLTSPAKLITALRLIGRDDLIHHDKDGEREYVIEYGTRAPDEVSTEVHRRRILDYCRTDVAATTALIPAFLSLVNIDQALVRGKFSIAVAYFEQNGLPVDVPTLEAIKRRRKALVLDLIRQTETTHGYGSFKRGGVFGAKGFGSYIERKGWSKSWPRTPAGGFKHDEETLKSMAAVHPELEPLRLLLRTITHLRSNRIQAGSDGRSRPSVWPFLQAAGRCNPRGDCILGQTSWFRHLLKPEPGHALISVDVTAEEYALAGALSGDPRMIGTYRSGECQHLAIPKSTGAVPWNATKKSHPDERALYKTVAIATQYGISGVTLSDRLQLGSPMEAEMMIADHYNAYPVYWAWSEEGIAQAYRDGFIESPLGWRLWTGQKTKRNSLLNFPAQSAGADVLRMACILAVDRGLGPYLCYPHHDAIYAHCPIEIAQDVGDALAECFRQAGKIVCGDALELRCDQPEITVYPNRYKPENGGDVWAMVQEFLAKRSELPERP
jgi:hypothetical protein